MQLTEEGEAQVDTLIYCLGGDTEDILAAATLSEKDKANLEKLDDVLQNHFISKRNLIYEQGKFHQHKQKAGETVEAIATALQTGNSLQLQSTKGLIGARLPGGWLARCEAVRDFAG